MENVLFWTEFCMSPSLAFKKAHIPDRRFQKSTYSRLKWMVLGSHFNVERFHRTLTWCFLGITFKLSQQRSRATWKMCFFERPRSFPGAELPEKHIFQMQYAAAHPDCSMAGSLGQKQRERLSEESLSSWNAAAAGRGRPQRSKRFRARALRPRRARGRAGNRR